MYFFIQLYFNETTDTTANQMEEEDKMAVFPKNWQKFDFFPLLSL